MTEVPLGLARFEARLPQVWDARRVDALLALALEDRPREEAAALARHALDLALDLGDEARAARTGLHLSALLEGAAALEAAQAAQTRFEALRDDEGEVESALQQARLQRDGPALTAALIAAELAAQAGLSALEARARRWVGDGFMHFGNDAGAIGAYERALVATGTETPRAEDVPMLLSLGALHLRADDPEAAFRAYRAASHLTHREGTIEHTDALGGLGTAYGQQGDVERAFRFLERAAQLAAEHGDHRRHARFLNLMASAQDKLGDAARAASLYQASLDVAVTAGLVDAQANTLLNLAEHEMQHGGAPAAVGARLAQALALATAARLASAQRRAARLLTRWAEAQGDLAAALAHQRAWAELDRAANSRRAALREQELAATAQAAQDLAVRRERLAVRQRLDATLAATEERLTELRAEADHWKDAALFDVVSGAHSRRYGLEQLTRDFKRSLRAKSELSLGVVGIELPLSGSEAPAELQVNAVLRTVAELLEQSVRDTDVVARFDQLKFMVIFPETGPVGAQVALRRMIDRVAAFPWDAQGLGAPVSVAVGLSSRGFLQGSQLLLDVADEEYYRARREGPGTLSVAQ
ncbi:diguanylate cyclase domain-containing protein [Deinococcus hohokamensis]|uniref:Diguanylate cyclase domain-containing protein n=1 Tax=Deinococcus hohokamensis TaxID=309883 RepID=A0ABV9IDD1_9DEIO